MKALCQTVDKVLANVLSQQTDIRDTTLNHAPESLNPWTYNIIPIWLHRGRVTYSSTFVSTLANYAIQGTKVVHLYQQASAIEKHKGFLFSK